MAEKNKTKDIEKKEIKKLEDYKTMGKGVKTGEKLEKKPETSEEKIKETQKKDVSKTKVKTDEKGAIKKTEDKKSDKKKSATVVLEREYIVPLRKRTQKVPRYKRAKRALKVLKEFIAKHMKVEERDLNKVKIDKFLNNEIWFRGIKKPPAKIKVTATKDSEGIVRVELVDIPEKVKFAMEWEKQRNEKVKFSKKKEKIKEEKPETSEEKKEESEKEKSSVEAGLMKQKQQAKEIKHTATGKHLKITSPVRKSLKK